MKIYIAGPMSGYPEFNFPAFNAAAKKLRDEGWTVFNPAEKDSEKEVQNDSSFATGNPQELMSNGWNFREAYLWDITKIIEGDAIYMLPGWEQSPGARGEHTVATVMQKYYPEYKIIYG